MEQIFSTLTQKASFDKQASSLPIYPHLEEICQTLKNSPSRFLVLTAETAAGKSTAVPPALLEHFPGKIFMLEPRRLAVLSIANRISELLGEEPGSTCGYRIQLENCINKDPEKETRLEIMTEGILTRRLQEDPLLDGVSVVILDEFHERSVHSDLALAFLKEAVEIRDDLFVIIMSATIDTKAVSDFLENKNKENTPAHTSLDSKNSETDRAQKCPVLNIKGRQFPVEIEYQKISVISAIRQEIEKLECGKAILVFLPGIREINDTAEALRECFPELTAQTEEKPVETETGKNGSSCPEIQLLRLHSSLTLTEQKAVLSPVPSDVKRIVLSSSIAETSLTVPGVYTVIDSGLSRINRMNIRLGMEELVTENESLFSAEQRSGRAGRLGNGRCLRLWEKNEIRPVTTLPEILRTDLSSLVLECSLRNITSPQALDWLEPPSASAWNSAFQLLELLGCISDGKITEKGKAVLKLGISPRLGCVALCRQFDTVLKYSSYSKTSPQIQKRFIENLRNRVKNAGWNNDGSKISGYQNDSEQGSDGQVSDKQNENKQAFDGLSANTQHSALPPLLEGFPDRVAHLVSGTAPASNNAAGLNRSGISNGSALKNYDTNGTYQFPSGRTARLTKNQTEKMGIFPEWIVAPEVDAGETEGKIYSWEALDNTSIQNWIDERSSTSTETFFENGKIQKYRLVRFGKIVLQKTKLPVSPEDYSPALCTEIRKKGFSALPFELDEKTSSLLQRTAFYLQQELPQKTTNNSEQLISMLCENPEEWLLPFLAGKTKIDPESFYQAIYWKLDGSKIDQEVPFQITLPNGKKRRLSYQNQSISGSQPVIRPVLEIIIQQIFGCFETPKIMGMPVLLKLLSPARRPLQITDDLKGFWNGTWPEICKEMKGRYPKHNWDYRVVQDE